MVTKLLLSAATAMMIAGGIASTAYAAEAPAYGSAMPSVNCENQGKGRHGNMTATCEESAMTTQSYAAPAIGAAPRDRAAQVNCDNQEKSRHGNQALGCETYRGAAVSAPPTASIVTDPEAMKGHRNTIGR
jgi:hypothetical protein